MAAWHGERNPELGTNNETTREQQDRLGKKVGEVALQQFLSQEDRQRLHEQLDELIDEYSIDAATVAKLGIKKISHWEMGYKDAEGEAQSHPLYGITLEADPRKFEPEWPPVNRVESVRLRKRETRKAPTDGKKAIILPDLQIPYQDENALKVALDIIRDVKPDKVILLGDLLDLESFGKFDNLPVYAATTQEAIIQAHKLLVTLRRMCPSADIVALEGNHDIRLSTHVNKNAKAAYGLKRADQPEGWPVLSVPYLTAMDQLDVEYISGYPANRYWINENLQVRHGHKVRSSGSTAKAVSDDERVSTIFGHIHRLEMQYKTHDTFDSGKTNSAFGVGCLCKIDGSVPSANRGVDLFGKPVKNYENWQQAICVVEYQDGDSAFNVSPVYINTFDSYKAIYNGKAYSV